MIVVVRFEVDDATRRALRRRTGRSGLATRKDVSTAVSGVWREYLLDVLCEDEGEEEYGRLGATEISHPEQT